MTFVPNFYTLVLLLRAKRGKSEGLRRSGTQFNLLMKILAKSSSKCYIIKCKKSFLLCRVTGHNVTQEMEGN